MDVTIVIQAEPIEPGWSPPSFTDGVGAVAEFRGLVRATEAGRPIAALRYEAYETMARRVMAAMATELAAEHPCRAVKVVHRVGRVPVGESAILVWVAATHRREAFAMLAGFMDRLKRDVPIWKVGAEFV